jgi:hypothetical protein
LSGHYFVDCQHTSVPNYAKDERVAEALWGLSDYLVAQSLGPNWRLLAYDNVESEEIESKRVVAESGENIESSGKKISSDEVASSRADDDSMPISCPGPVSGNKAIDEKTFTGQCPL